MFLTIVFFLFRGLFVNLVYSVQQTTDMPSIVSAYRGFVVVVRTAFVTNPLLVAHQPLWGGRIVFVPPSNSVWKKHMNRALGFFERLKWISVAKSAQLRKSVTEKRDPKNHL